MLVRYSKPNFFIVGAPKSATTSLDYYLGQHPDVFMCPVVDTWHFMTDMQTAAIWNVHDRSEYERLFADARDERIIGEKSVFYLYSPAAATEIHRYNPDSLILMVLRQPAEMMFSLYRQFISSGNDDIYDFEQALNAESDRRGGRRIPAGAHLPDALQYRQVAKYADQVRRYIEMFGRDRVKVFLYDDIKSDLPGCYRQMLQFLEVDETFVPDFQPKNVTSEKKIRNLNIRRMVKRNPIVRLLARSIPRRFRGLAGDTLSRVNAGHSIDPLAKIPNPLREELTREMEPDIRQLADLIDRDLSTWLKPSET